MISFRILLFYSPKPRSQVRILIHVYQNWPIQIKCHHIYLTQAIKYVIEERQHRASCYLGNVIKSFTSIVPHPTVLVIEASQYWGNKILQIQTSILQKNNNSLIHTKAGMVVPTNSHSLPETQSIRINDVFKGLQ